jgi:hypothetical protein
MSTLVENFETYGNVEKPREARERTVRTNETISLVEEMVVDSTKQGEVMSIRRISRELGISAHTVHLILRKDLHFHPYHPIPIFHLTVDDPQARIEFSHKFLETQNEDEDFVNKIIWTDESIFSVNGHVRINL